MKFRRVQIRWDMYKRMPSWILFIYYLSNEDMLEKLDLFFTLEWICSLLPVNAIRTITIATNDDAQAECSENSSWRSRSLYALRKKDVCLCSQKWYVKGDANSKTIRALMPGSVKAWCDSFLQFLWRDCMRKCFLSSENLGVRFESWLW